MRCIGARSTRPCASARNEWNGHTDPSKYPNVSVFKNELCEHLASRLGRPTLKFSTWASVTGTSGGLGEKLIPGIGDMEQAPDFTPLLGEREREPLVPQCSCGARVKIDEEGMEASCYAMCAVVAAAIPDLAPQIIPFIVDRPFAFVLVSSTNEPMFIGLVNCPEGY